LEEKRGRLFFVKKKFVVHALSKLIQK